MNLSIADGSEAFSRLSSYLSNAPIRDVAIIALGATALLAVADYATGYEVSFSIFYLVPVAFATWYGDRQLGLFFASVCAASWVAVDYLGNHQYSHPAIPLWNGVVRLGFFGIVTLLLDARRRTEDELREAKLVAEAASRAKNAFLAGVSHELRTPLNAIIGYAALLVEEGDPAAQSAKDAVKIERASRHLLHLINNVLDFSKIEAGRLELFIEDIDACDLLDDVRVMLEPQLRRNRNRLEIDCPQGGVPMHTDGGRLRQILLNLAGNAAKFTTDGCIRILVTIEPDTQVAFAIEDNGIGMAPEELARVFSPFTQATAETHRRYGGSGLGLTISRLLCEVLGGNLTAESEKGRGSRFLVRLPAYHEENGSGGGT